MDAYPNTLPARLAIGAVPAIARATAAPTDRWIVAGAGVVLQLCLGTVYAWSFFQSKIVLAFGWSNSLTAAAFSIAIFTLGLAAAAGGLLLPRAGPRRLALTGAVAYGLGHALGAAGLATNSVALFLLGYGVVGGAGLGLGYVTPVATALKWFPDKRGLVTGLVVMGFGLGALLMSKLLGAFMPAGIVGPQLVAYIKDHHAHAAAAYAFECGIAILAVGLLAAFRLSVRRADRQRA